MPAKQKIHNNLKNVRLFIFVALGVLAIIDISQMLIWSSKAPPSWYRIVFLICLIGIAIFSVLFTNILFKKMVLQSSLFEDVLKFMSDGVIVINQDNNFSIFNNAAEKMTGINPGNKYTELDKYFEIFYTDQKSPVPKEEWPIMKALKGLETENQEQYIHNKQRENGIFLNVSARPLYSSNGSIIGGMATFQDITEKFNLIEELKKKERLFHGLFEFAPDAIIGVNEEGSINRINSRVETLFGYKREELFGNKIEMLIPEKYRSHHIENRSNYQKDPKVRPMGTSGLSLMGLKKDGTEFPLAITLGPLQIENESMTLAVIRDISVEKESEQMIKNLNQELQTKIGELEYANRELKAFSYSVSHDLRAPLRSMIAFSNGILEENESTLSVEAKRKLNKVLTASERMGHLVDALLTLAQLSRKEINWVDVDLSPIAKSIVGELESEYQDLKIDAKIVDKAIVKGDPDLLYALLKNLFSNSAKFSSKKEISKIEFGIIPTPDKSIFFVRDNGVGFEMEYAKNLFHDFERLHSTSEFEGTGIGLSSARRIVEKHGGKIWAESKPNEGAVFYFQI